MKSAVLSAGDSRVSLLTDGLQSIKDVTRGLATRESRLLDELRQEAKLNGFKDGYEEGLTKGHQEGHAQGYAEGRAQALAEIEANERAAEARYVESLNAESALLQRCAAEWFAEAEVSLGRLAVEIAARILATEIEQRPETILDIAKAALAEATNATRVRLRANPFHIPILHERKETLLALSPMLRDIELVEDASIRGGCVIDSDGGVIDARIEAQLANLARAALEGR